MLALVLREPHTKRVAAQLDRWEGEGIDLHAPWLAQYEVASALTRHRAPADGFSSEDVEKALRLIAAHEVHFHPTRDVARIVEIAAVGLKRHNAYDAAYLALIEELDAELWTLDGPLARNAGDRWPVTLID